MRMFCLGLHTLNFSARDSTHKKHRDIIAAFRGLGGLVTMTPAHRTPLFFAQLLIVACCHRGAIVRVCRTATATRAYPFKGAMAAPLSSFWEAFSARPVRDTPSLHPQDPLSGLQLPFDNIAG
ncbi:hypothetical protein MRX96_034809 [Rhipicephalus microplus]